MRLRPLSKRNKYYLPKRAFYGVYHMCLQYPDWKREYNDGIGIRSGNGTGGASSVGDPTAAQAIRIAKMGDMIRTIEETVMTVAPEIYPYLLRGVTEPGMTFDMLKGQGMPCERDMYYDRRRRFYYLAAYRFGIAV